MLTNFVMATATRNFFPCRYFAGNGHLECTPRAGHYRNPLVLMQLKK